MNEAPEIPQLSMDEAIMGYLSQSDYVTAGSLYMSCYNYAPEQAENCLMNALWCLRHPVCQLGVIVDHDAMIAHGSRCIELANSLQTVSPSESVA